MEDYEVEPCYNIAEDKWQFNVKGMILRPKAVLDICMDEITAHNYKLIEDITDLTNKYNDPKPCNAKKDFELARPYPMELGSIRIVLQ